MDNFDDTCYDAAPYHANHDTLFSKFTSVQEIAEKLGPIIQSPGDDDLIQVTEQLNGVCSKLQTALGLSSAKVDKLEEAVSLAVQLKELQVEVETALLDVESLVEFVEVPTNGNPEEIKNELESSKLAREALTEQLVFVDALVNKSHDLLELLSLEKCQKELDKPFIEVRMKYDRLSEQLNEKTNGIIQAWRESTTSLADASESFLEELYKISDAVHLTDSISPDMETIRRQIAENKALSENLETCGRSMDHLKKMLVHLHRSNLPDEQNKESQDQQAICDDLTNQLNDLELLQNLAGSNVQIRATKLNEALSASEKYEENFTKTKEKLVELLRSIGSDDVKIMSDDDVEDDISTADEDDIDDGDDNSLQMKSRIEALSKELEEVEKSMKQCTVLGGDLKRLCEDGAEYKIGRDSAVLEVLVEEVRDRIKQKREELDLGEDLNIKFENLHQNVSSWLKETEEKLLRLSSSGVASETRAVKIQIEELKVFMRQLHPHLADLESINHLSDLISKKSSSTSTSSLVTSVMWKVRELSETWNRVVQGSNDREMALTEALVEIGELDQTMDDIIGHMQQVEADIQTLDEAYGDPKYIEAHLKNIEMLLDNVDNQLPSIKKLNERVNKSVLKSCPSTPRDSSTRESSGNQLPSSKLYSKLQELNETYELVHCLARQKKNYLLDSLKEVKDFMKSVEDLSHWLTRHCKQLKAVPLPGALPNTAQNEYNKFMKQHTELERKLDESRMLLFNGEEMKLRCKEDQAVDLQLALVKLEARAYDAHVKSKLEKERLEDHLKKVQVFHAAMNHHDNWMGGAEKDLSLKFKTPSKLLKRVVEQISEHKEFKEEVSQSQGRVHNLDLTGTYLKYFGSKRDASHVKMQLFGSKSRWKRLVMRTEERGRNLQRAYREDYRFFQSWKELNEWLSEVMIRVSKMEQISSDELMNVSETLKRIQHEFQMKQCSLHSTLRQGRHLRDRCTPIDPEKKVLEEMIDGMREKWREACRSLNMCERVHCERLLESRQVTEACRSVEEALLKFVSELSRDVNLRGDLHAVRTIKEHHITIFEEIESKKEDTKKLLGLPNVEDTMKLRMQELVIKVEVFYQERMVLIDEALVLAQKFNDVVMSSSEKLSQIEQQLNEIPSNLHANFTKEEKFKSILEKLELIELGIREEEENVKMIDSLCNEILLKPHPSSVGSINYCRSLVDAQFHKLTKSVIHKKKLVEEGLHKSQVDIEVLEDLLTWISDELAILALKENNSIPEDLNTADALFKEHLDFHNELSEKKKIVERFLSSCPSKKLSSAASSSSSSNKQSTVNTISDNPKLLSLNNKWKLIWKVSTDRKRKLQEMFSRLLELRTSSKFSFTKWCCRFSSWVRNKRVDLPDFFQLTNRKRDGSLSKKEFIDGLVMLRFQCRVGDLNAAFDELDVGKSGKIHYGDFIQKLSLEPKKIRSQPVTDAEQIHRNIEEQLTHCKCQKRYNINKIADGKYKFGDKGKMCLVRFLNSTVMVRVGGGWVTLPKYLESNDPCRVRGRTNLELREKYLLPDGGAQTIINFQTRRKSSLASASQSGDSSHQLQSPSSDSCRSSYCSSSVQKNDNKSPSSGSSTPAGRKTPTTSSARSRTPDYLLNESSISSSAHSLSHKTSSNRNQTANQQTASNNKTTKIFQGNKVLPSGRTPQNGGKLGGSRTSVGGTSSEGGSPRETTRRISTPRQAPAKI